MSVNRIFSAGRAPERDDQVQELLKNLIVITNYLPGIRSSIGWRGVFRIPCDDECWTFKIAGYQGVFGINYSGPGESEGCFTSSFDLLYFPDADEDAIEKFPINGAVFAYMENYKQMIREFPDHPEFFNYFITGKLHFIYHTGTGWISIRTESLSDDVVISVDGVIIDNSGKEEFIIEPGEPEQAVPSFMYSSAVFDLLVSSLSFHAGGSPSAVSLSFIPAGKRFFKDGVLSFGEKGNDITTNTLSAIFAEPESAAVEDFFTASQSVDEIQNITWKSGMSEIPEAFSGFTFMSPEGIVNTNSMNRSLLGIETKPPLYIVSGFLGAGKTSFIKNFLEFQAQKYLFGAVIQNELGEAGLDGKLMDDECRVVEMDEGCVCCSLSGNLRRGINSVISEFVPDFIILETTGAANPMNLISEIHDLKDLVKFDSVTIIVDALNIEDTLNNYEIAKDQLRSADIIIINKTDDMDQDNIKKIEDLVTSVNKKAVTTIAEFGRVNPALLYDSEVDSSKVSHLQPGFFPVSNKTHRDDGITNVTINFDRIKDRKSFLNKIENLPVKIFRIKGILKFEDDEHSSLFQYVSGRYDITMHNEINPDLFLVFIGKEINSQKLMEYFAN